MGLCVEDIVQEAGLDELEQGPNERKEPFLCGARGDRAAVHSRGSEQVLAAPVDGDRGDSHARALRPCGEVL